MENPNLEPDMVSIRCPGCGQRFNVPPDLDGKMVECGSCDHRFRVSDEVTVRNKKFYPGERKDPSLQRFGRVPLSSGPEPEFDMAPMPTFEGAQSEHVFVAPVSPQRVIVGFAGVIGALIVALVIIFGGSPGGMLDGAPMSNRMVLVGFTSLVASVLIFLANRHQKTKAILGSLAVTACLLPLPYFFQQGLPTEGGSAPDADPVGGSLTSVGLIAVEEDPYEELKSEIGYSKLAEALEIYGADGVSQGKTAVGVWVRDIRLFNLDQVFNFLVRSTGANPTESWSYPRPPSDHLVVLRDVPPGLDKIAGFCDEFGSVERVIKDLNLIEVKVDNQTFVQGPVNKMQDPEDPSFYELNRRELESIDLKRAQSAVKRLVEVEPKLYRSDIVQRLQELFEEGDLSMKRDVARALTTWAVDGDGSVTAVRAALAVLLAEGEDVPDSVVQFLVEKQDAESAPLIHQLWLLDAQEWEALYGDLGAMIEPLLLKGFEDYDPLVQLSAIRLLRRTGSSLALPALEKSKEKASNEVRVSIDEAIEVISKRVANE